ncbi:MAG: patatin [Myxococcales bacterium]|nr:patatin [Myxococcales bacterium]
MENAGVTREKKRPWTGLVLSGGGARGAYEAGVIQYLRTQLPPEIQKKIHFDIISGTSVGAINACFLAANNHVPKIQGKALSMIWERLRIEGVYQMGWREVANLPRFLLGSRGRGTLDSTLGPGRLGGLLNTLPLEQLVRRGNRWRYISKNIKSGNLRGMALNATHIASGKTHVFAQTTEGVLPAWSTDPQVAAFHTEIGPNHALASAAIPWVFPSVEIDGELYCDGSLKQNTPISPALRLGADRLLMIGLQPERNKPSVIQADDPETVDHFPSAVYLLGKILSATLVDKTEYDMKRLQRFNALLDAGTEAYGPEFEDRLGQVMKRMRGAPFRKIKTLVIRPSEEITQVTLRHINEGTILSRAGGLVGSIFRRMADRGGDQASDLLSYLLFDGEYAADLIQLAMRDAHAQREEIIAFFEDN